MATHGQDQRSNTFAVRAEAQRPDRIGSIDLLRGIVMIVMALDHVRDFIHQVAMAGSPTDLSTTTAWVFGTRWITHVCAPAFALTAGLGAYLGAHSGKGRVPRFLVMRGLWLMLIELLVMRIALYFSWSPESPVLLLVLWSLGLSMVVLAGLIRIPIRVLGVVAVATILLHPLLDGIPASAFGACAGLWNIVHQVGAFSLGGVTVVTPYPLVPWVAVMALGFALGPLFHGPPEGRRRRLWMLGGIALAGFTAMRLLNLYGDPVPWRAQATPLFTILSFLNTSKYPASPAFLLMTLSFSLFLLAAFDRVKPAAHAATRLVRVFGQVPLFFYVLHFFLAHAIASGLAFLSYGPSALDFVLLPYPSIGGPADRFPPGFGHDLETTYLTWGVVLILCYPLCRWFAGVKSRRGHWWLRYL
ncbi:DUF1624 domain-containing protein [Allosphingosinicella deserti]|uniref:Heparan-alpha-glucosaminide N-acetyltransferase catalytic domain-containing protein n=1 Tax=Allosphingosinicella deserti TaxID=2116704 RepID=A0A2P7QG06_9SPHN|nr:heparan-alpha-glucosaminide N-acetyltransferase domain-containing protein [Sphingomonas deserti]PSJ36856.1 hypothetical protein C7I55_24405 [Sphingomonas deserti]